MVAKESATANDHDGAERRLLFRYHFDVWWYYCVCRIVLVESGYQLVMKDDG